MYILGNYTLHMYINIIYYVTFPDLEIMQLNYSTGI